MRINKNSSPFRFGFTFRKKDTEFAMQTDNKELFTEWEIILCRKLIMHTFHEEFTVKKLIGQGHYANVNLYLIIPH